MRFIQQKREEKKAKFEQMMKIAMGGTKMSMECVKEINIRTAVI